MGSIPTRPTLSAGTPVKVCSSHSLDNFEVARQRTPRYIENVTGGSKVEFFAWMVIGATSVMAGVALAKFIEIGQEK